MGRARHRGPNKHQREQMRARQQAQLEAQQHAAQRQPHDAQKIKQPPVQPPQPQLPQPQSQPNVQEQEPNGTSTRFVSRANPSLVPVCDVAKLEQVSSLHFLNLTPGQRKTLTVATNLKSKLMITIEPHQDYELPEGTRLGFYEFDPVKFYANLGDCSLEGTNHPLDYVGSNPTDIPPLTYMYGFLLCILCNNFTSLTLRSLSL